MGMSKQTDPTTHQTWMGPTHYGQPSMISPECLELYMRNARSLRSSAFIGLFSGLGPAAATDRLRKVLRTCKRVTFPQRYATPA